MDLNVRDADTNGRREETRKQNQWYVLSVKVHGGT